MSNENSAVEFFAEIVRRALEANASDLHLTREASGKVTAVMRVDGVMGKTENVPAEISEKLFGRIKYLAKMKTYQVNFPQDGRISGTEVDLDNDIRVSSYPTVNGEKIVLRFFRKPVAASLDQLGYPEDVLVALKSFLRQTSGMLLLTGPAGSGKSTTIYACLNELAASSGRHIVTIEDPVEQEIPDIMQTEINTAMGLTFAEALKRLLRQDPEVIVIGEIRDEETAKIAVRSAFTGHLVIATLHAGSCKGVIERLYEMVDDRFSVLSAVAMVLNQRLVRKICVKCAGQGCSECHDSGYNGRMPVAEYIRMDDKLCDQIRQTGIEKIAPQKTLVQSGQALIAKGSTDKKEICRLLGSLS